MLAGSAVHARGLGRCALLCFVALFPSLAFGQAAAGGQSHSLLATPAGDLYAWGWNNSGQIGDGTSANRHSPILVLSDVVGVAAGSNHSAALKSDGTVWTWGHGSYGQLGHGNYNSANIPTQVPNLSGVTAIVSGARFTLALKSDGTVWGWGLNNTGQLGDGTTTTRATPALVSNLSGITGIAARGDHALALTSNGSVYGWGANNYGQVGDGTTVTRTSPVLLSSLSDVIEISAGDTHCLARTSAGVVYAWGGNGSGQLATGNTANKSTPTEIASLGAVRWLTAGGATSHGTLLDGGVKGWGANSNGEIGDTTTTQRTSPVVAATPPLVMLLESGGSHSLAITDTGEVWAWGSNTQGQLGDGTTTPRSTPVRIAEAGFSWPVAAPTFSVPAGTYSTVVNVIVASATAGADIHYTLTGADPTVSDPLISAGIAVEIGGPATLKARAWKEGTPASTVTTATYSFAAANPTFTPGPSNYTTPKTVTLASTSPGATVHYTLDGSTPTTSSPAFGSPISIQTTTTLKAVAARDGWNPSAVVSGTYTMNFGSLSAPVISPASGTYDGLVLVSLTADPGATIRYTTNGNPVTATSTEYSGPFAVEATSTVNAKAFRLDYATSAQASAAYTITVQPPQLSPTGGAHQAGQVITVTSPTPGAIVRYTLDGTTPTATSAIAPAGGIVAGNFTLKAIATKPGATSSAVVTGTYEISSSLGAPRVAAGENFSLALRSDGVAWAWGYNGWGQLGDNTTSQRNLPVIAGALSGISSLATGDSHSLAVRTDGSVVAWGANTNGQLGDGTTTARYQPVAVQGLSDVAEIDGGNAHTLALLTDGTVRAWGRNAEGQLGDGTTTQRLTPTEVSTLANVAHVSAGYAHSLALLDDGTLWAWGTNGDGQLGFGDLTARSQPVQIASLSSVAMVSAGSRHTVALLTDGTVRTWGHNASGQLGDGGTTQRNAPVLVPGLTNIVAIAAGTQHTLALAADGTVWACGQNMNGQVGDGTGVQRNSPVAIQGLPTIAAIAAGTQHSLAIATDGSVWAWGRNHTGAIGDGTTTNRLSPVQIADGDMNWSVPAPILSLASGTYSTTQSVTITSQTPGATLRYTTDGTDPTPSSATIASGSSLPIAVNTTLKARAYAPEAAASGIVVRNYVLRPTSPTFSPPAGTYTAGQSVTIATTTPDATIRYTLDGSLPTEASSAYAAPIAVETTQTLRAIAFRDGWSSSTVAGASYTMNFGTLTAPTISPSAGLYEYGQLVSMSAEPGTEIRYTTNGSAPGPGSTLYTGPIALQSAVTITAKAFRLDYTPSAATSRSYSLRANAPVLSPGAGTYAPSQQIAMTSATPGTTIHYTTTGADPTSSDPSVANGGTIAIGTFTLKARAFHGSMATSDVSTVAYVMDGCLLTLSTNAIERSASVGGGTVLVSYEGASCSWDIASDATWLLPTITSNDGSGVVSYWVAENDTGAPRSATLAIGDKTVPVAQAAFPACTYQVQPNQLSAPSEPSSGQLSIVTNSPHCVWAAEVDAPWLSVGTPSQPSPYASTVLADGASAYWRLNESSGNVALDAVGTNRHGAYFQWPSTTEPGALGDNTTAISLRNGGDYIQVPHDSVFSSPSISWEAWIKVDEVSAQKRTVMAKGVAGPYGLHIAADSNLATITWTLAGAGQQEASLPVPVVDAGWQYVVFTYDRHVWRGYLNGVEVASGPAADELLHNTLPLTFGQSAFSQEQFDGSLDEVAIYPYALAPAQIAHHYSLRSVPGVGTGQIGFQIAANAASTGRNGTLTVAGVAVPVNQAGDDGVTIASSVTPSPNALGWHTTDVTVSFTCDGSATVVCPEPVVVSQSGIHEITRQATNGAGNSAATSVTLQVDKGAPYVSITSPEAGTLVNAGLLIVTGTAIDGVSLSEVTCNGSAAMVELGIFTCEVAVPSGTTNITVRATDLAGNSVQEVRTVTTTDAVAVEPTSLRISPRNIKMVVGATKRLRLLDDLGRNPVNASWSSDDAEVAVVSTSEGIQVHALSAGAATLTAVWRGVSASIDVTVAASHFAAGTTLWEAPTLAGSFDMIVQGTASPSGPPQIYAVERASTGDNDLVRAFDLDGGELWTIGAGGRVTQLSGDAAGGALVLVDSYGPGYRSLISVKPSGEQRTIASDVSSYGFAVDWRGPVYYVRASGLVGADIGMGSGRDAYIPPSTPDGSSARAGIPTIMEDGTVVLPYVVQTEVGATTNLPLEVRVLAVKPSGQHVTTVIHRREGSSASHGRPWGYEPHKVVPNGAGGYIAAFSYMDGSNGFQNRVAHRGLDADFSPVGNLAVSAGFYYTGDLPGRPSGDIVVGTDGELLMTHYTRGASVNSPDRVVVSNVTPTGVMYGYFVQDDIQAPTFIAVEAGGFIASYPDGTVGGPSSEFDQMSLPQAQYLGGNEWIGIGANGTLTAMAGPHFQQSGAWSMRGGGTQNWNAQGRVGTGIFVKGHYALPEIGGIQPPARHASIKIVAPADWADRTYALPNGTTIAPFSNVDERGNVFATIGAGPAGGGDTLGCGENLVSQVNRLTDVTIAPLPGEFERLSYAPFLEPWLVIDLLRLDSRYGDDALYGCWPYEFHPDEFNSNGYVAGLLQAAKVLPPRYLTTLKRLLYAGWDNPVPLWRFQ